MTKLERINRLKALRQRVDDELAVLTAPLPEKRARRMEPLQCGSERAYQRHAHFGDTAKDGRRVTCEPCLEAHREHERVASARRRLRAS